MSAPQSRSAARQNPQITRDLEAALAGHKAGQRDRAERLCRKVLRREPHQPDALRLLGVIASERGRHDYAVQLLSRALAGPAASAEAHYSLGNVLRALGRLDEAADEYRAAIALQPDLARAHCNLAAMLIERDLHGAALEHATRAAELMPELAAAHINRGIALARARRSAEAEAALRRGLAVQADNAQALSELGSVLADLGRLDEAKASHLKAIEFEPNNPFFHLRLGDAHLLGGDPDACEAVCRHAVSLAPRSAPVWSRLAHILRCVGRFDEARSCLRQALELDPELPHAYVGLAVLGERAGGEEQLRHLRAALADPGHPVMVRIDAGFALGRLLDNSDRYDEAFPCFSQANSLYREFLAASGMGYDRAAFREHIDGLIETCRPEVYAAAERDGNPSEMPVLVVGMPRSGTSLVEQIAASHSRVAGAGELRDVGHILAALQDDAQEGAEEDPDLARRLRDGYIARLQQIGRGADRVVDKMPDNIITLGMAALLFPKARVVFCRRDPRDTSLSCYFHRFDQPLVWYTDLVDCGSRVLELERLAEHWRGVLPLRMLTIDYEALVADLEGESRRLIEFLGLDWEPACLDFHKTERPVRTASGWQVRQPLFTRSVGRWRKYERHLGPLLQALAQGPAEPDGSAARWREP
jgi:tetratricopeptide (TPR) repeat protein